MSSVDFSFMEQWRCPGNGKWFYSPCTHWRYEEYEKRYVQRTGAGDYVVKLSFEKMEDYDAGANKISGAGCGGG